MYDFSYGLRELIFKIWLSRHTFPFVSWCFVGRSNLTLLALVGCGICCGGGFGGGFGGMLCSSLST